MPAGSLDADDAARYESCMCCHSFNFLAQIPWTEEFRGIPELSAPTREAQGQGLSFRLEFESDSIQARYDHLRHL